MSPYNDRLDHAVNEIVIGIMASIGRGSVLAQVTDRHGMDRKLTDLLWQEFERMTVADVRAVAIRLDRG